MLLSYGKQSVDCFRYKDNIDLQLVKPALKGNYKFLACKASSLSLTKPSDIIKEL